MATLLSRLNVRVRPLAISAGWRFGNQERYTTLALASSRLIS